MTHVKRMLISADPQEVRVAIVEGGKLSEAYIERRGRRSIVGNIYKGRVDAVLPGHGGGLRRHRASPRTASSTSPRSSSPSWMTASAARSASRS